MLRRVALLAVALALAGAGERRDADRAGGGAREPSSRRVERDRMILEQLRSRDIRDARVLDAMRAVPRHRFVSPALQPYAYADSPLPIGRGQTISQPYVVALMIQALGLRGGERILEVGSGSGYAAAVLSRIGAEVYGIELERELFDRSVATLADLGYANVHLRHGDGFAGWPERAPFDAILLSCAAPSVPPPLWEQLAPGGRLLYPRGGPDDAQDLVLVTKTKEGPRERTVAPVRFVPMRRGAAGGDAEPR